MPYKIRFARQARIDLDYIFNSIQAESSPAATDWYRGLEAAILTLASMPHRCAATPERPGLRHLLYGNKPHVYRVIFLIDEAHERINIAQIRHGARRPLPL